MRNRFSQPNTCHVRICFASDTKLEEQKIFMPQDFQYMVKPVQ